MTASSVETASVSTPRTMQEDTSSFMTNIVNSSRKPARLSQNTSTQRRTPMENEQTKIENILHVFDLINDNVINAKIGKKVAAIIAETGETAEHVIKTVGLKQCMPDDEDVLSIILKFPDLCQDAKNGSDDALHELVGRCMRASGGKLNPGMIRNVIFNFDSVMKKHEAKRTIAL